MSGLVEHSVWVFHRGALGDSVLLWPRLRAIARGGERVRLVTDGAKGMLAQRELGEAGVVGVDAEQRRFNKLWIADTEIEPVEGVARVIDFVSGDGAGATGIFRINLRRMFPGAEHVHERPPVGGLAAAVWLEANPLGRAAERSNPDGAIVLHIGAGSEVKRWPLERFIAVAGALRGRGLGVALIAGEVERERLAAGERGAFEGAGGRWLVALDELHAVLAGARAFVGCDSGPTHLAAQMGLPTLALFGPTRPDAWAPVGPLVRVVAPERAGAMGWLGVERVMAGIAAMLGPIVNIE